MTDLSTKSPALGRHLDEEERQGLADDTLSDARRADADAHVAHCPSCAEDVNRLRLLVMRTRDHLTIRDARPEEATVEALWPGIRARIESAKVVRLAGESPTSPARQWRWTARSLRVATWISVGMAAAILFFILVPGSPLYEMSHPHDPSVFTVPDRAPIFAVDDSATAYQREVETMLEELELQRAMLRPDVAASLDHDLHAIDRAIAELRDALKHDPNNPALRQLLAASYRQKRDLLERIANAS